MKITNKMREEFEKWHRAEYRDAPLVDQDSDEYEYQDRVVRLRYDGFQAAYRIQEAKLNTPEMVEAVERNGNIEAIRNEIFYFMTRNVDEKGSKSYQLLGSIKEELTDMITALSTPISSIEPCDMVERVAKAIKNAPKERQVIEVIMAEDGITTETSIRWVVSSKNQAKAALSAIQNKLRG